MNSRAFSLVESLIAGALAVLLILPLSALFQQSRFETEASLDEIRASLLARELVDQIQSLKYVAGFEAMTPISSHHESAAYLDLKDLGTAPLYKSPAGSPFSRLFLSPLPPGYRRLIKLYPANLGSSDNQYLASSNLLCLEVLIEWTTLTSKVYNRQVSLFSILAKDEIFPEI
jgi:hypothetical protein